MSEATRAEATKSGLIPYETLAFSYMSSRALRFVSEGLTSRTAYLPAKTAPTIREQCGYPCVTTDPCNLVFKRFS